MSVIRFYGGKHIGAARFDAIKTIAKTALVKVGIPQQQPSSHRSSQQRRQMRSMTQSVRGKGHRQSSQKRAFSDQSQQDITKYLQNAATSVKPMMFRPTPAPSPVVSPERILADHEIFGPSDGESSQQSPSDEDELQSALDNDGNSQQEHELSNRSGHESDADDKEDGHS